MSAEPSTTKDKQITIDVPEDRVAEFYAFYGRFLAGFPGRRGQGRHRHGRHCGHDRHTAEQPAATGTETQTV